MIEPRPALLPKEWTIITKLSAFIFDMDGVITDTVEPHYQTWKRLAEAEGIPFTRADNEHLRGLSRYDSLLRLLKGQRQRSPAELEELLQRKNQYFLELVNCFDETNLLPGVKPLLLKLKQLGFRIALASSSRNVTPILENLGIVELFDFIADGASVSQAKPAPDLFLRAAQGLGVNPEQCLVVEDASAGIAAAHAAGMLAIGIGPAQRVGKADLHYETVAAIDLKTVLKIAGTNPYKNTSPDSL